MPILWCRRVDWVRCILAESDQKYDWSLIPFLIWSSVMDSERDIESEATAKASYVPYHGGIE